MNNENEWLKELKVGDKVIEAPFIGAYEICIVQKVTKAQVLLTNGRRYFLGTGKEVAGGRMPYRIHFPADEKIADCEHRLLYAEIYNKLPSNGYQRFAHDQLQRIAAIINEPKET